MIDILTLISKHPELVAFVFIMGVPWMAGFYMMYRVTKRVLTTEGAEGLATIEVERQLIAVTAASLEQATKTNQEMQSILQTLAKTLNQHEDRAQERFELVKAGMEVSVNQVETRVDDQGKQLLDLVNTVTNLVNLEVGRMQNIEALLYDLKETNFQAHEDLKAMIIERLSDAYEKLLSACNGKRENNE